MNRLAAVLIEPRAKEALIAAENHIQFLPKNHKFYLFGSRESLKIIREHFDIDSSFVEIGNLTQKEYNMMLGSKRFWQTFIDENILIFQSDSALLKQGIEQFYEYDFIGAPIRNFPVGYMNGGLSLRRKSAMLKVIDNFPAYNYHILNEDIYFVQNLMKLSANLPSVETAQNFSVETTYQLGSHGYHAIDKHLTPVQCDAIRNQYKKPCVYCGGFIKNNYEPCCSEC